MKAKPMDLPTTEAAQWSALEWVISAIGTLFVFIIAWATRIHFTVSKHTEEIGTIKEDQKGMATKTDIEEIKFSLRLLLKHALGVSHDTEE